MHFLRFIAIKIIKVSLDLGGGFGVMKFARITNLIKWTEIECLMLPEKVVNSKQLKNIIDHSF